MVKIMENPIKMDEFGGKTHYFRKHPFLKKVTTTTTWRLGWVSPLSHRSKLQPRICSKSKPSGPAPTPPQPVGRFLGKFFNARFLWSEKNGRDFWVLPIEMTRRWQATKWFDVFFGVTLYIYIHIYWWILISFSRFLLVVSSAFMKISWHSSWEKNKNTKD